MWTTILRFMGDLPEPKPPAPVTPEPKVIITFFQTLLIMAL